MSASKQNATELFNADPDSKLNTIHNTKHKLESKLGLGVNGTIEPLVTIYNTNTINKIRG